MRKQLDEAMAFARKLKEDFLNKKDEMHPFVIVEGKDGPMAIAIAPSLDTEEAMEACLLCRIGFESDGLTISYDGRVTSIKGDNPLANLSLAGENLECIISFRIDKNGKTSSLIAPYVVRENEIYWLEEGLTFQSESEDDLIRGNIPDIMRNIWANKPIAKDAESIEKIKEIDANLAMVIKEENFSSERISFLISRAIIGILIEKKFQVMDNISIKHIEWTDARPKGKLLVDTLIEGNHLQPTFKNKLYDCIDQNLGTPAFLERFEFLLEQAQFKHPSFKGGKQFISIVESLLISPLSHKQLMKMVCKEISNRTQELPESSLFGDEMVDNEFMELLNDINQEDDEGYEEDFDEEGFPN